MKSRKLIIGLLITLALVVSSATFAYWASAVNGNSDTATATVTIGQGGTVETTVTVADLSDTSALVPTAYVEVGVTTDTATLTLPVLWADTGDAATGATGTLAVTIDSKTLGTLTAAQIDAMFTITVTSGTGAITLDNSQDVVITVEFTNEPATQAIYDQVANGTLSLGLTFTVTTS